MQTASWRCYIWQTSELKIDWKQTDFILSPIAKEVKETIGSLEDGHKLAECFGLDAASERQKCCKYLSDPQKRTHPAELSERSLIRLSVLYCMSNMNVSLHQQAQSAIWIVLVLWWREQAAADNLKHTVSRSWHFSISISTESSEISEMKNEIYKIKQMASGDEKELWRA